MGYKQVKPLSESQIKHLRRTADEPNGIRAGDGILRSTMGSLVRRKYVRLVTFNHWRVTRTGKALLAYIDATAVNVADEKAPLE